MQQSPYIRAMNALYQGRRYDRPAVANPTSIACQDLMQMGRVITALGQTGLRDQVKILVGGAPIDRVFAGSTGADGYANDAGEAGKLARQMCAG